MVTTKVTHYRLISANILNQSLRRRPSDESVGTTTAKIKLPSNDENMKVPVTNTDIIKAMSNGEIFLDVRLTRTNSLIRKL